jgi:hypothetical protein
MTIGGEKYRPVELFHGRFVNTGQTFAVPIEKLKLKYIQRREASRNSKYSKLLSTYKHRPVKFKPYELGDDYSDRNNMPLKIGNVILVDSGDIKKNNFRPFYRVVATNKFPTGISWDTKLVCTEKLDVNSSKKYVWALEYVQEVTNGETENDSDTVKRNSIKSSILEHVNVLKQDYIHIRANLYSLKF